MEQAACIGDETDPCPEGRDAFLDFVSKNCVRCPVLEECGDYGQETQQQWGVWGATYHHGSYARVRGLEIRDQLLAERQKCDHDVRAQEMKVYVGKRRWLRRLEFSCRACRVEMLQRRRREREMVA
jgi:hypothetical protein